VWWLGRGGEAVRELTSSSTVVTPCDIRIMCVRFNGDQKVGEYVDVKKICGSNSRCEHQQRPFWLLRGTIEKVKKEKKKRKGRKKRGRIKRREDVSFFFFFFFSSSSFFPSSSFPTPVRLHRPGVQKGFPKMS
jgi:hypothetical protein